MKLQTPARQVAALALLLWAGGVAPPARAQGVFQNLGFESARIILDQSSPFYPYAVNATNALPGWKTLSPASYPDVLYDALSFGEAAVSIHDAADPTISPIAGRYSVGLQGANPGTGSAAIWQTGQIPGNAQSLTFWGQLGSLQITFNGQLLSYSAIGSGSNYTIYGADISAFAGQTGELRFTAAPNTGGYFDNIRFSVPEPSVFGLWALGAALFGWRALRRRK